MWPVILVLALVPMVFFWSDSVRDMFPALQQFLPEKSSTAPGQPSSTSKLPAELAAGAEPGRWYVSQTKAGFVAWVMSADGQYRTAVGCHAGAPTTLQVTHLTGATLAAGLHLNYQYGKLPLTNGFYTGPEAINGIAQFKEFYLQNQASEVLAQFNVPGTDSNSVARSVASTCTTVQSASPQ